MSMTLEQRRKAEIEKYRKVYKDYPRYRNRPGRMMLLMKWLTRWECTRYSETFLDVGCGRGEVVEMAHGMGMAARGCEVVYELCKSDDVDLIAGAHALPYEDDSFDLVACTEVMEHLLREDVPMVLGELARVARGPVLVSASHIPDRPGKYGPETLHVTVEPRDWWEKMIAMHMRSEPMVVFDEEANKNGTWWEVVV